MDFVTTDDIKEYVYGKFVDFFGNVSRGVHANAVDHGWWEEPREDGTLIALIMSEAAEALEALRKGYGCELNAGYWSDGVKYLRGAEQQVGMPSLFDMCDIRQKTGTEG